MFSLGKLLRETGQALDRMGMRGQENWAFLEKICRHRTLMNLFDQRPQIHDNVFVAPNAAVIGNVNVMDSANIWYGAVVRGDQSPIAVGGFTSIGDRSAILSATHVKEFGCDNSMPTLLACNISVPCNRHRIRKHLTPECASRRSTATNPTGFAARTFVGNWVTIGQNCVLKGCTVDDFANIGDGCVILEGAYVEQYSVLEAGSVLPAGARVPQGEIHGGNPACFVRKVPKHEMDTSDQEKVAESFVALASRHNSEFLPYGTLYQHKQAQNDMK